MLKKTLSSILTLFLTFTLVGVYPVMASPSEQTIEATILDGEKIENAALLIADDGTTYC